MKKRKMDVVVISDIHLGTYGARAREVAMYLRSISPQVLVLNGDIIDGWQFSRRYFPQAHMQVLKEIINLMDGGTRVIYITGNHDEVLRKYTDLHLGKFQLTDKLVLEINDKTTWIFHGDVFDNTTTGVARFWAKLGSSGYAMLILLNRFINACMKVVGKERVSLSKAVMNGVNKAWIKVDKFEKTVTELAVENGYDYVICGHIHRPKKKVVSHKNGTVVYLNSGDWVESLSAVEYYKDDWHVYHFDPDLKEQQEERRVPALTVVSDHLVVYVKTSAS